MGEGMKCWVVVLLGVGVLLSGCATSSMKGTPFYTGEYEEREGLVTDRVNLWPMLYYRDPALSVLWPLMEFSPDHLAVRPIYSTYNRESEHPVYNVLWPIGRFDTAEQDYRVFPVYWGDEYFNVVPLYWHKGDPFSGTGYNSLFPFWIWNNKSDGSTLHVMWPLYANYDTAELQGWRLWPLYGSKDYLVGYDRFYAWPLGRAQRDSDGVSRYFFPLYGYDKSPERTQFISLPYSRSLATQPFEKSWDLALPLWYRGWEGDTFSWMAIPALSWGIKSEGQYDNKYAVGMVRSAAAEDFRAHHVLPFYYHSRSNSASAFYSLPWWSSTKADGSGWAASFPFYYGSHSGEGAVLMTPLYARKLHGDGSVAWRCYVPIIYLDNTKDAHFMTLLGGRWRMGDQHKWLALPLLSGGSSDADSGRNVWLAGLAGSQWDEDQKSQYVLPFYLWGKDEYLYTALYGYNPGAVYYATPLAGRFAGDRSGSWIFPLYHHERKVSGPVKGSYLLLGKYEKSERRTAHKFFPLYGYNHWKSFYRETESPKIRRESKSLRYLLLGWTREDWDYEMDSSDADEHSKQSGFFPLWKNGMTEGRQSGDLEKTSSYLGFLYDTRQEKQSEKEYDYIRRRVLWRLLHYEKLNGDTSTDIFPGITIDSHKDGYYKCSVLWRLFRYEKDPEGGGKKLDLLFVPIRR